MKRFLVQAAIIVCGLSGSNPIFLVAPSRADEAVPVLARKVFEQNRESSVKVTGVAQITITSDRPGINPPVREEKVRADGTIVDDRGLVVLALSAIDPSQLLDGREVNTPAGPVKMAARATLKELEIILGDGTEIPATLVFKDEDIDLAFVRPKADAAEARGVTFDPIDLSAAGTAQVADYTVSVARLDEPFINEPAMSSGQLTAVIERPRPFFIASNVVRGCPTFTLDGKLLGIGVVRHKATGVGQAAASPAIVPADEIRKLVGQIPGD